jgi:hypothetical protein
VRRDPRGLLEENRYLNMDLLKEQKKQALRQVA